MAATFRLEVATPDRLLIQEDVSDAQVPGAGGALGILPEHSPLISELGNGELSYTTGGRRHSVVVHSGWVEVQPDAVRVLANRAERPDEIDVERARQALKRAQDRISKLGPEVDLARALNALKRAQARLTAKQVSH
ncbi:MAG: F0F1 ATP synthase subunit epsilon [Acidobacteria bacterium]|nr:F0F1 ATP synthase subunit epsilon [Acidobacteriota bacterium]